MYTGIESYWEVKGTGVVSTSSEKGSSAGVGRVGRLCGKCWTSTRPWRVCRKWIPRGESRVPSWWEEQSEYMWGRNKFEIFMDGLNFFPWITLLIGNSSSLECTCSILHPSFSTRFFLATSWTWHLVLRALSSALHRTVPRRVKVSLLALRVCFPQGKPTQSLPTVFRPHGSEILCHWNCWSLVVVKRVCCDIREIGIWSATCHSLDMEVN